MYDIFNCKYVFKLGKLQIRTIHFFGPQTEKSVLQIFLHDTQSCKYDIQTAIL